jgi:hypothetical protein
VSPLRVYGIAAAALLGMIGAGTVRWRAAVPAIRHQSTSMGAAPWALADSLEATLAEAEDLTVSNDPFRLANAPAAVRFNPSNENGSSGAIAMVAPPVRPNMTLKAIVGGPPWQAIVDGIPGQPQGTIVRAGNAFDKLVARAVTRDSVVIRGPDTTWVLSFRRPE